MSTEEVASKKSEDPTFTRGEVAKILNVSTLTIANREKAGKYPEPRRDLNNHRVYSVDDIFNLQLITYSGIDPRPVISILFDKGYRDTKEVGKIVDSALSKRTGTK